MLVLVNGDEDQQEIQLAPVSGSGQALSQLSIFFPYPQWSADIDGCQVHLLVGGTLLTTTDQYLEHSHINPRSHTEAY